MSTRRSRRSARGPGVVRPPRPLLEPRGEPERGAYARLAPHAYVSPHYQHQLPADGQTETRAPVATGGGGVCLGKGFEEPGALLFGHAYARIPDLETDRSRIRGVLDKLGPQGHLPLLSELDRVAEDVGEDLPQTEGIAAHSARRAWLDEADQFQALLVGVSCEQGGDLFDLPPQLEVYGLQAQAARLYLGEVQDVVEDGEQSLARVVDRLRVLALLLVEVGVQKEVCHADNAVHGRPYLVAHVGQELALCPVGLLGPLPRRPHLLFGQFALAIDSVEQTGTPPHRGGDDEHVRHGDQGHPELCAVEPDLLSPEP